MFSSACHLPKPTTHYPEQQDPGEDHIPPDTVCDVEGWTLTTTATDMYTPAGIIEACSLRGSPQRLTCAARQNAQETTIPHPHPGTVRDAQCDQNIPELSPSNRDLQTVPESPQPPSSAGTVGERGGLDGSCEGEGGISTGGGSEEGEQSGREGEHGSIGQELKSISQSPKSVVKEEEEKEEQKEEKEEEEEEDKKKQTEGQREEKREKQRKEDEEQEGKEEEEQEREEEEEQEGEEEEDKERDKKEDEEQEREEDEEQEREEEEEEQEREEEEEEQEGEEEEEDKEQDKKEDEEQEREADEEQEREEEEGDKKDNEQEKEEEVRNITKHQGEKKEDEMDPADDLGVGEKVIVAWTQSIVAMAALQTLPLVQEEHSVAGTATDSHILSLSSLSQWEGRENLLDESDEEIEMPEQAEILTNIPPPPPPPPPSLLRLFTKTRTISTPPLPHPPPLPGMLYLMKADGEQTDWGSGGVKTEKPAPLLPFTSLHEHQIPTYTPPSSDSLLMPASKHGEPPSKRVKLSPCSMTTVQGPIATSTEREDSSTSTLANPEIAVCGGSEAEVVGVGEPVKSAYNGSCTIEQAVPVQSAQVNAVGAYPPFRQQGMWNEGEGRRDEDGDSSAMEHEFWSPLAHSTKDTQTEAAQRPHQDPPPLTRSCSGPLEFSQTGMCTGSLEPPQTGMWTGPLEPPQTRTCTGPLEPPKTGLCTGPLEPTQAGMCTGPLEPTQTGMCTGPLEPTQAGMCTGPLEPPETGMCTGPLEPTQVGMCAGPLESPQSGMSAGPLEPPQTGLCAGPLEEQVVPAGGGRLEDALLETQSMYVPPLNWQKQEGAEVEESWELPSVDEAVSEDIIFPASPPARWVGGTSAQAPRHFHCSRATGWGCSMPYTALGAFID